MNAINQKSISRRIFKLVLPLAVLLFIQVAANAQSYTAQEEDCYNQVQNKVAWNTQGNKIWGEANVRSLCRGVKDSNDTSARTNCFSQNMPALGWEQATKNCSSSTTPNPNSPQTTDLSGNWAMFEGNGKKYDNPAVIKQNGASVNLNNGYGSQETVNLEGSKLNVRTWKLTGTVSADGTRIDWSNGFYWTKNSAPTTADSGTITRTITFKNNAGLKELNATILMPSGYSRSMDNVNNLKVLAQTKSFSIGQMVSLTDTLPLNDTIEVFLDFDDRAIFKAILPTKKDLTELCYEVTGTYFVPIVKACDGGATYESKHISFKNEAGYNSTMSLTYYPTGGSTTKTETTVSTTAGFQTKLYLPLDSDTDKPMTLKISKDGSSVPMISREVSLSDFDITCYKVWGSFITAKVSPCSLNPSARKIKLWNNSGYSASLSVTYYDKDQSGKDVERTVKTNIIELTQTETIEVPNGTSPTPIKINFTNHFNNSGFSTMTAAANFTGDLCYKVEGTTFAPTAATCDDTVGDTTGETRQIRFQNDAGYDAQMIVLYFEDQVINGTTFPMAKTLSTGFINGLGGKFRLVSIPKNTAKGMQITISLQGSTTVKNDMFSTTLPADFAASPQPCFKVTGTTFDPSGGKCNQ